MKNQRSRNSSSSVYQLISGDHWRRSQFFTRRVRAFATIRKSWSWFERNYHSEKERNSEKMVSKSCTCDSCGYFLSATLLLIGFLALSANGFAPSISVQRSRGRSSVSASSVLSMSSYDISDYSSGPSDFDDEGDVESKYAGMTAAERLEYEGEEPDVKLEQPPPLSKNAGNTFIAMIFDKALDTKGRDWEKVMEDRMEQSHNHVRWCREANLYNETFNTASMVDVLQSYQVLSSCATRPIGHILILESTELSFVKSFVATDPIVEMLGCEIEDIPIYRWRHIKDYTLRMDDGRDGYPNVLIQMDRSAEELGGGDIRAEVEKPKLEYLIRSRKVIAAGPLHLGTEAKNDPSSLPVGDIIFFNAMERDEAIEFAENDPSALAGLYDTMRVHKYNTYDITGKFVSKNVNALEEEEDAIFNRNLFLREEMRAEGYPVDDDQTPWFNY